MDSSSPVTTPSTPSELYTALAGLAERRYVKGLNFFFGRMSGSLFVEALFEPDGKIHAPITNETELIEFLKKHVKTNPAPRV
jgi:hypothetical protein